LIVSNYPNSKRSASLCFDKAAGTPSPLFDRMVQFSSFDRLSSQTIVSGFLHDGILTDWLLDHVVNDNIVFPGAGYISFILSSFLARNRSEDLQGIRIRGCTISFPLVVGVVVRNPLLLTLYSIVIMVLKYSVTFLW
jgi:hypothetical protein